MDKIWTDKGYLIALVAIVVVRPFSYLLANSLQWDSELSMGLSLLLTAFGIGVLSVPFPKMTFLKLRASGYIGLFLGMAIAKIDIDQLLLLSKS